MATLRQGSGLPRRSVDPDAGAAAGPDGGLRGHDHGRADVAPGADDGDARPRQSRPARVPRGQGHPQPQGRHRRGTHPRATRRWKHSARLNARRPHRPGGDGRAHEASFARQRRIGALHHPGEAAGVRDSRRRLRQGARRPRRRPWLVRREAEQGRRPLERPRAAGPPRRDRPARRRVHASRRPGSCCWAGAAIAASIVMLDPGPEHAGGDDAGRDDPRDARRLRTDAPQDHGAGPLDGAGRAGVRARPGSTRRTRRSSGARRSASRATSRRCSSGASRTSRTARSPAHSLYFPIWYQTASGQTFASYGSGGSGGSVFSDSPIPDLGGMMSALGTIGNSPSSSGSGGGRRLRRRWSVVAVAVEPAAASRVRLGVVGRGPRRPSSPAGTLHPWVQSKRWKTSSRS